MRVMAIPPAEAAPSRTSFVVCELLARRLRKESTREEALVLVLRDEYLAKLKERSRAAYTEPLFVRRDRGALRVKTGNRGGSRQL
jgi:hypothetical protein